jgi:hypothetical protein
MARFFGELGYAESNVETVPGVFRDVIVERQHFGDILQNIRNLRDGQYVNSDITVNNRISVVADAYALEHFHAIRYVKWSGVRWLVDSVTVQRPRLILELGGVYNGDTP